MTSNDDNNPHSFQTEEEYSIISRQHQAAAQLDDPETSSLRLSLNIDDSEHLMTSHQALATAYEHVKRRIADVELTNKTLQKRLNRHNGSTDQSLPPSSVTYDVTKAWEAYKDKCLECESLREELRTMEQRLLKSQNVLKVSSTKDELLRAQSLHDSLLKKLQQSVLETNEVKNKEILAREELEKEKEYHAEVMRATEAKHHTMQRTIDTLQHNEQQLTQRLSEMLKENNILRKSSESAAHEAELKYQSIIHELEGKVLEGQQHRCRLEEEVLELRGLVDAGGGVSDQEAVELVSELESLTNEIKSLKRQASQHSMALLSMNEMFTNGHTPPSGREVGKSMVVISPIEESMTSSGVTSSNMTSACITSSNTDPNHTGADSPTPQLRYPPPHIWTGGNSQTTIVWPPNSSLENSPDDITTTTPETHSRTSSDNETSQMACYVTEEQLSRFCPVCNKPFPLSASEADMTSHINGHFSQDDDADDVTILPLQSR
uniref:Polyamine-modulated factor 1-binding protein 1 n=1 Tax=Ciona intestinalis TaxID=7719 RepID=F6TGA7_CIOIN|nr:polyamine-modulated factor 1-binding protein 1 [Ciona intestinalis]|eukprot:XP_026695903.1 polyamine-modulated factor 1-binding protein 1 [Ciona intestinalis]